MNSQVKAGKPQDMALTDAGGSVRRPRIAFGGARESRKGQRVRSGRAAGALRADRPTDFGLLDVDCYCMSSGQGVERGAVPFARAAGPSTRRPGGRTRVALESDPGDQFRPPRWGLLLHEQGAHA
jgi:hypothetical protein